MKIERIAVIGCGAMGSGIAYVSALTGYTVRVVEQNEDLLQKGLKKVREHVLLALTRAS